MRTLRLSARHWLPIVVGAFILGGGLVLTGRAITGSGHAGQRSRPPAGSVDETRNRRGSTQGPPNAKRTARRGNRTTTSGAAVHAWTVPPDATATFARLERSLAGPIGVVVAPLGSGPEARFGPLQSGHAWSTMKVPVLVTYDRRLAEEGHPFDNADREDATLAIEQSDNAAIDTIFGRLEQRVDGLIPASEEVEQTLRTSGDRLTVVNTLPNSLGFSTFGQTEWSLAASAMFYSALAKGCLLEPAQTAYILRLMGRVVSSERWGAGEAGFARWLRVAFKGGWGPEPGGSHLVRQTARLRPSDARTPAGCG
jgi:hypothetical protein